jgi:hypothetical protein
MRLAIERTPSKPREWMALQTGFELCSPKMHRSEIRTSPQILPLFCANEISKTERNSFDPYTDQ